MPTWTIILLAGVFVMMDLIIVGAVLQIAGATLRDMRAKFPAQPVRPDAVRREFQSFSFGMVNLGGSIHVAVDEDHLHLFPSWIARRMSVPRMSIPWELMRHNGRRWGRTVVQVEGVEIRGPAWALDLAKPKAG